MRPLFTAIALGSMLALGALSTQAAAVPGTSRQAQEHPVLPLAMHAPQSFNALPGKGIVGTWLAIYDGGVHSAFAQYNKGGTSSQLVDFSAKTGNALLGDWKKNDDGSISVFLTGWSYDDKGVNLTGYFTKAETVTLSGGGYAGTFEVTFYDLAGNILFQHDGTLTAVRTSAR